MMPRGDTALTHLELQLSHQKAKPVCATAASV